MNHVLKCWPQFFDAILNGQKRHELRRSDDRNFAIGDTLELHEYDPKSGQYSGRKQCVEVTYITDAKSICAFSPQALHPNFCILSIQHLGGTEGRYWREK